MNTNISALQTLVEVWQNGDYITGVTPVIEQGETIGYVITFAKGDSITIYHGEDGKDGENGADGEDGANGADGKDGVTLVIGVRQDSDNIYYWTLNGEWLTDEAGNKIKASGIDGNDGVNGEDGKDGVNGEDGKDGADGADGKDGADGANGADGKDGITPQLKIEDDYWWLSTDNGLTWTQLGKAKGEDGVNYCEVFKGVTEDDNYVYFTLADDSTIAVLKDKELSLELNVDKINYSTGHSYTVSYTIKGATSATTIELIASNDLCATLDSYTLEDGVATGDITIYMPDTIIDYATVAVLVSDGCSKVVMKAIHFEYEGNEDVEDGILYITSADTLEFPKEGGVSEVKLQTNLSYRVELDNAAAEWLTVADTRAALREETLTLSATDNEGDPRNGFVYLIDIATNSPVQALYVSQRADEELMQSAITFNDTTFESYMLTNFDLNQDGAVSREEALVAHTITVSTAVTDLTGLEYCTNIKSLSCANNLSLTALNTSTLTKLEKLNISGSTIATIDLSNNPRLKYLNVNKSSVSALLLEGNSDLEELYCSGLTALTNRTLILENHPMLWYLSCSESRLTHLDVTGCPKLVTLNCKSNSIPVLNLTNNESLEYLTCNKNVLTELDLPTRNNKISNIDCSDNKLSELDLQSCMKLTTLIFNNNLLTKLNLGSIPHITEITITTKHSNLYTMEVRGELLESLVIDNNLSKYDWYLNSLSLNTPKLKSLTIYAYANETLDLSIAPSLESVSLYYLREVANIDITGNPNLTSFIFSGSGSLAGSGSSAISNKVLKEIDFSKNAKLKTLLLYNTDIERLDLSNNLNVESVKLYQTYNLAYINLGENTNLTSWTPWTDGDMSNADLGPHVPFEIVAPCLQSLTLRDIEKDCSFNLSGCKSLKSLSLIDEYNTWGLTSVDLEALTELTSLKISGFYHLNSLKLNKNTLSSLYFSGDSLSSIDLSDYTALKSAEIYGKNFTSIDVSGCSALTTLNCKQCTALTNLNLSGCSALKTLTCNGCSKLTNLDLSDCSALRTLWCYSCSKLTNLNLSGCSEIKNIRSYSTKLSLLNLSDCVALENLECNNCELTELDVTYCPLLTTLDCSPMSGDGLAKLYVTAAQKINGVTVKRNADYVPAATEIVVVDAE